MIVTPFEAELFSSYGRGAPHFREKGECDLTWHTIAINLTNSACLEDFLANTLNLKQRLPVSQLSERADKPYVLLPSLDVEEAVQQFDQILLL